VGDRWPRSSPSLYSLFTDSFQNKNPQQIELVLQSSDVLYEYIQNATIVSAAISKLHHPGHRNDHPILDDRLIAYAALVDAFFQCSVKAQQI
jgi:hypothetical protein